MTRKRRLVSPEERALWDSVARKADPLKRARHDLPSVPDSPPGWSETAGTGSKPAPPPLPRFEIGARVDHRRDHDLMASLAEDMARAPLQMDRKAATRLKRGKTVPEARLDLHGMTLSEAHPALVSFILGAQVSGKRVVLVITGKGKPRDEPGPIPRRLGALRHQVPQWLRMPPLGAAVMDVIPAHARHGGSGAYYVSLRRQR